MKFIVKSMLTIALTLSVGVWQGCGSSSSGTDAANGGNNGGGTGAAASMKDLNLSSVLMIELPDGVKGTGSAAGGLRLTGGKSFEACELRETIREALSNLTEIGTQFCMLENDPNIEFGKKLNIDLSSMMPGPMGLRAKQRRQKLGLTQGSGGPPPSDGPPDDFEFPDDFDPNGDFDMDFDFDFPDSLQLWVDNSQAGAGKLTVYFCVDEVLTQMIEIEGVSNGRAKGRMIIKDSMEFNMGSGMGSMSTEFHRYATFDNRFTDPNQTSISIRELVSMSSDFGNDTLRRALGLELNDTGVSKVTSSYSGSMYGSQTSFASAGLFDVDFGSVIATGSISYDGDPFTFSNISYFDGASNVLDPTDYAAAFGENGKVKADPSLVPGYLPESFEPPGFPAGAWDCGDTEDIEMSMSEGGDGMMACFEDWDQLTESSCFSEAFTKGEGIEFEIDPNWDFDLD